MALGGRDIDEGGRAMEEDRDTPLPLPVLPLAIRGDAGRAALADGGLLRSVRLTRGFVVWCWGVDGAIEDLGPGVLRDIAECCTGAGARTGKEW